MTNGYAKVALLTPLPQLDRLFEYRVAANLVDTMAVGVRVMVPLGRAKQLHEGFVISISDTPEYEGDLAEIAELVSAAQVLKPEIYLLCRAVADRQAVSIGDVLRLAVVDRSVAVEKSYLSKLAAEPAITQEHLTNPSSSQAQNEFASRAAVLIEPRLTAIDGKKFPFWVADFIARAAAKLSLGQSSILLVPDFRDQNLLREAAELAGLTNLVNYSTEQTKSKRYAAFLETLSEHPTVVIGSRSSVFAPCHNLGLIAIWDDGDTNHIEPNSPYIHSREVALIRQSKANFDLVIASHSRSAEVQRLLEMGYFADATTKFVRPTIAVSDEGFRVDGLAYRTIREGLSKGPVLVQVSSKGNSSSAFCGACSARGACKECNGPLWVDSNGQAKCRWCNAFNLDFQCRNCGQSRLRLGQAGATRTASELARAFAPVRVIESTGDNRIEKVGSKPALVISTPGAEPLAEEGYAAVVLLDCHNLLSRDTLKATEDSIRLWSNALALMAPDGRGAIIGLAGELGQKLALWQQAELAEAELASRRELAFAPAVRLASVTAAPQTLASIKEALIDMPAIKILGPLPAKEADLMRILIRYDYNFGAKLAAALRAQVLLRGTSGARVNPKNGRASRPVRIKMDEPEVI